MALRDTVEKTFLDDALPALSEYVTIPCLSPAFDEAWEHHNAIENAIEYFAAWAGTRDIPGLHVSISRLSNKTPILLISIPAQGNGVGKTLLYGHLDKQPPLGKWTDGLDPYIPVLRDDRLFGRGTGDDGYAMFSALIAIETMAQSGRSYGECVILIEASEESGSPDLDAHLDAEGHVLDGIDFVVCLDSGALSYDRLWMTTSLRGNIVAIVRVDVLERGVHSGEAGGVVPSSFRVLRQLLDRVEDASSGEILIDALCARPPAHALSQAAILSREMNDPLSRHFPTVPGLQLMGRDGADHLIRQSWSASLSVTGIEGIPSIAEGGNVLRSSTTAKLSVRLPPTVNAEHAQNVLVRVLESDPPSNATITVKTEQAAQGWLAPEPAAWLGDALEEGSMLGFGHGHGSLGEGGSIPFLATLGQRFPDAQFLATGVLGPDSNAHGIDESLHLPAAIGITTALVHILHAHGNREMSQGSDA